MGEVQSSGFPEPSRKKEFFHDYDSEKKQFNTFCFQRRVGGH